MTTRRSRNFATEPKYKNIKAFIPKTTLELCYCRKGVSRRFWEFTSSLSDRSSSNSRQLNLERLRQVLPSAALEEFNSALKHFHAIGTWPITPHGRNRRYDAGRLRSSRWKMPRRARGIRPRKFDLCTLQHAAGYWVTYRQGRG